MQTITFKFTSIIFFLLSLTISAADNAKIFTSNGVIYSYAVQTKTIQPATVIFSTRYYTTVKVKEVTLTDNAISTTTEELVRESVFETSVPISVTSTQNLLSIETTNPPATIISSNKHVTTTLSPTTLAKTTIVSPLLWQDLERQTTSTIGESVIENTPTPAAVASVHSASTALITSSTPVSNVEEQQVNVTPTSTSLTSTITNSQLLITSAPTSRSTTTLAPTYDLTIQTSSNIDGTCYVYDDDLNDEYYSTAYISGTETVDAATTITSFKTVYKTMTIN